MRRPGVIASLAIIVVSLLAGPGWAGLNVWSGTGPRGGPIRAVLVDPVTPSTIYVGTVGSGVFKSTDSGATWAQNDPSGQLATRTVRAIVLGNGGTLYAGVDDPADAANGGVFQSTNGGGTWTVMDSGLTNKKVMALAFDNTSLSLYAGTREETVGTTTFTGGVFKWDGLTWTNINNGGLPTQLSRRVQALAIDTRPLPTNPAVIYAGTDGVGVYKTIDGGATWTQISNQGFRSDCLGTLLPNGKIVNIEILALVVDMTIQAETLYAGAKGDIGDTGCEPTPANGGHQGHGAGFFRLLNGDWDRRMGGEFEDADKLRTTLSTNVWTIMMNGATIYIGTDIGVFRSTDGTGSWKRVPASAPGGLISLPVRALGIDPTGQVTLYAGTNGRGVFKRLPPNNAASVGMQQWTAANTGLTALKAQAVTVASGQQGQSTVLAGLDSGGIVKSVDGGATWQNTSDISTTISRTVLGIAVDPSDPSAVYAATGKGVIKSVNGGDSWALASTGLPTTTSQDPNDLTPYRIVGSIIVDPANQDVLYAAVGGVHTSVNGGASWVPLNGNPLFGNLLPIGVTSGDGTVSAFLIDHGPGTYPVWGDLYVATDGSGVFRSTNGGMSWTGVNTGIPLADQSITALALEPFPQPPIPRTLYAGTSTGKVFRSDNGTNWGLFSPAGLPGNPVTALTIELADPRAIYASLNGAGVYVSHDGTFNWTPMNAGLSSLALAVTGLVVDGTQSAHTLYAATLGRGILDFQISLSGAPFVFIDLPAPPYPHPASTSPIQLSGTAVDETGVSSVLWSTNRDHAGSATGTTSWTASVPLEPGLNVITVTAVDTSSNERSASITVTLTGAAPRTKTFTVPPCRVLDTRLSNPLGPISANGTLSILVAGDLTGGGTVNQGGAANCGVPDAVTGVFVNVVAVNARGPGHLTVYPFNTALPLASTLNFTTGQTIANGVLVPTCTLAVSCAFELNITMGPAAADLVIDVAGYLAPVP